MEALGWERGWHVDADHINMDTGDKYLGCSDFFTIDVADFIGQAPAEGAVAAFVEKHQELIGSVTIEGIDVPFDISREYVEEVAGKYLAAVAEAGTIYRISRRTRMTLSPRFPWTKPMRRKRHRNY
ncbi:MAG: hypothetical protein CM1200mP34_4390 [Verrucomicrobiales bacterium]|nr:MAG: hypothetical protein CM1200mP34_4390 [Verrucomicrobiales bacterium]